MHYTANFINLHLRSSCVYLDYDWSSLTAPQPPVEAIFRVPNDIPAHRADDTLEAREQATLEKLAGEIRKEYYD